MGYFFVEIEGLSHHEVSEAGSSAGQEPQRQVPSAARLRVIDQLRENRHRKRKSCAAWTKPETHTLPFSQAVRKLSILMYSIG